MIDTKPLIDLDNIEVAERAALEPGEGIACLLSGTRPGEQVWMRCGNVTAVSDDGTLVIYEDYADRGPQWLDPTDWIARWPE